MSAVLALTMTVSADPPYTSDDCDHVEMLGVVRRALLADPRFVERYGDRLLGLVVPLAMDGRSDSYRSAARIPTAVSA